MLMERRKLIQTLEFPKNSDARALAEGLMDDFNVASISGSKGEHEVQFVSPAELVVVISPSKARFFYEPLLDVDEVDDEHGDDLDDDDDDDPYGVADEISDHLARRVGLEPDDEDDDSDDATSDDNSDLIAREVITRLLDEGLLELVTPRSRPGVEGFLAHRIAQGRTGETLGDALADAKGVAELYASNEQLAEILAACRPKRTAASAATSARTPPSKAQSKAPKTSSSKVSATGKPKAQPNTRKSTKSRMQ